MITEARILVEPLPGIAVVDWETYRRPRSALHRVLCEVHDDEGDAPPPEPEGHLHSLPPTKVGDLTVVAGLIDLIVMAIRVAIGGGGRNFELLEAGIIQHPNNGGV